MRVRVTRAYRTELDLNNAHLTACTRHAGAAWFTYNCGLACKHEAYRATGVRTEYPIQRLGVDAHRCGEVAAAFRLLGQEIGNPQRGGDGDQLCDQGSSEELTQRRCRRGLGHTVVLSILWWLHHHVLLEFEGDLG